MPRIRKPKAPDGYRHARTGEKYCDGDMVKHKRHGLVWRVLSDSENPTEAHAGIDSKYWLVRKKKERSR